MQMPGLLWLYPACQDTRDRLRVALSPSSHRCLPGALGCRPEELLSGSLHGAWHDAASMTQYNSGSSSVSNVTYGITSASLCSPTLSISVEPQRKYRRPNQALTPRFLQDSTCALLVWPFIRREKRYLLLRHSDVPTFEPFRLRHQHEACKLLTDRDEPELLWPNSVCDGHRGIHVEGLDGVSGGFPARVK